MPIDTTAVHQLDPDTLLELSSRVQSELMRRGLTKQPKRKGRPPQSSRLFQVPNTIKHLLPGQIKTLTASFRAWLLAAQNERTVQARTRIWLLFLLLRYTGMRLGEALSLDDRQDFDFERGVVHIRGDNAREILLPLELLDPLRLFFDAPLSATLRGRIFHLDQGYVRRKFSERGKDTGIARELLNPRVLRHSRAVELLRQGVPPAVVDAMLGQSNLSSPYISFSDADTQRIMNHYIYGERKIKTSARNVFVGQISAIRDGQILNEVELTTASGLKVVSVITMDSFKTLGLALGMTIIATVKAPWVILVKEDTKLKTSARNKFCGVISKINKGKIAVDVVVDLPDGTKITSLITDESATSLDLQVGSEVCALVKAFSVILSLE